MEPNSLYTPEMSFFVEKKSYKFCNLLYCLPLYLIGLLPEVVSLAEEEVPLGVERLPHLAQPTVAAAALQAVLVPVQLQCLPTTQTVVENCYRISLTLFCTV